MGILRRLFASTAQPKKPRRRNKLIAARNEAIRAERATMTIQQLAEKYGLSNAYLYNLCAGIEGPRQPHASHKHDDAIIARDLEITRAYEAGEAKSQALADKYGVSRERICQILRRSNVIATAAERRRIAQEEIAAEKQSIRDKVRIERQKLIDRGLEIVRNGGSINAAIVNTGLPIYLMHQACKDAGIESKHGRWRDRQPKIDFVRALRAEEKSWDFISAESVKAGYGRVYYSWISMHCPDLIAPREPKVEVATRSESIPFRQSHVKNSWSKDKIDQLTAFWSEGLTASQCAERLGVTRNAVIGKINRLRKESQCQSEPSNGPTSK